MTLMIAGLAVFNLGLIYLLLAAPIGERTVRLSRRVSAPRERIWQAVWPLGKDAGWSGEVIAGEPVEGEPAARLTLSWEGRDGRPIERKVAFEDLAEGEGFTTRIVDDSSLDPGFWRHYRQTVSLVEDGRATRVSIEQRDRYRGLAFLIFRYFALRREMGKLKVWAETGKYRRGGWFEHPLSQVGFALLSALFLWPFFGLGPAGLAMALVLTTVVALHELGHLAAFRLMGHRKVRMIFIPLLGGIAIGGRPYNSHFEVAFVALMGAGFSAFLVPLAVAGSAYADAQGLRPLGTMLAAIAGCMAMFNVANLVPVWKFDGGQVLRQVFSGNTAGLAAASFVVLSAFLALGYAIGFSSRALILAGAIFAILSLITAGSAVKPRHALTPIEGAERFAIAAGFAAVFVIHASGMLWATGRLSWV